LNGRYAVANFITYGTPESIKLGAGERGGVYSSFVSAFGRAPTTSADWENVLKIGAGRFPGQTSKTAEEKATTSFKKIYKRAPDMANPNDSAAVTVMAYGLRPDNRNLASEAASIKTFKNIYKKSVPTTAEEWDIVRAIAYSGATREVKKTEQKVNIASE
jgi:hypothetical protein